MNNQAEYQDYLGPVNHLKQRNHSSDYILVFLFYFSSSLLLKLLLQSQDSMEVRQAAADQVVILCRLEL